MKYSCVLIYMLILLLSCCNNVEKNKSWKNLYFKVAQNIQSDLETSNLTSDDKSIVILVDHDYNSDSIVMIVQYVSNIYIPSEIILKEEKNSVDIFLSEDFDSNVLTREYFGSKARDVPMAGYKIARSSECAEMFFYRRFAPIPPGTPYEGVEQRICIDE